MFTEKEKAEYAAIEKANAERPTLKQRKAAARRRGRDVAIRNARNQLKILSPETDSEACDRAIAIIRENTAMNDEQEREELQLALEKEAAEKKAADEETEKHRQNAERREAIKTQLEFVETEESKARDAAIEAELKAHKAESGQA